MLKYVTIGYCDKLTDARAKHEPVARFFYDVMGIIRVKFGRHTNLDAFGMEILQGVVSGDIKVTTLEDVREMFSSPHGSLQVIDVEEDEAPTTPGDVSLFDD